MKQKSSDVSREQLIAAGPIETAEGILTIQLENAKKPISNDASKQEKMRKEIREKRSKADILQNLELLWGHMLSVGAHKKEKPPMFVTNERNLSEALERCADDSTLVIDGHGNATTLTTGDQQYTVATVSKLVDTLPEKVTHVVLSACSTGTLLSSLTDPRKEEQKPVELEAKQPDGNLGAFVAKFGKPEEATAATVSADTQNRMEQLTDKLEYYKKFKNRGKVFVKSDVKKIFETMSDSKVNKIAAVFAEKLWEKMRSNEKGIAFTFSPSLLNPGDHRYTTGNAAAPHAIPTDRDSAKWPGYIKTWERDSRVESAKGDDINAKLNQIGYKSITLYSSHKNKKALEVNEESDSKALEVKEAIEANGQGTLDFAEDNSSNESPRPQAGWKKKK